jgi:hypothetical protein
VAELGTDLVNGLMNPPPDPNDPAYQAWLKAQQAAQPPAPTPESAMSLTQPPADTTGSQLATATAPTLNLNHPTFGLSLGDYYKWQKEARAGGKPDREAPIRPLPSAEELAKGTEPARAPPGDNRPSLSASPRSPSEVSRDAQVTALRQGGMSQDDAEGAGGASSLATEMAPGTGTALAGADTAYHLKRGEYAPAAIAALGLAPGVGKIAGKGIQAAGKGVERMLKKGAGEELADAVRSPAIKKTAEDVSAAAPYVNNPVRMANPGVYKRPDVIAKEANDLVQPEHPALKALFGVTRDDLYEISKQGTRRGNMEPNLWMPGKSTKMNEASASVMTDANAQRLVDTLGEAMKYPELTKGMVPWYVGDPLYQKMVKLVGEKRAKEEYVKFNSTVSPFSAGSAVPTEITRGTAANMYAKRGDLDTFRRYGNVAENKRGPDYPDDLRDVPGHMMHGVQVAPVERFLKTGEHGYDKNTVKIPLYTAASGVPQTGFQTRWAVPDTHFASALGLPEVRAGQEFRSYMSGPEYRPVGPWFRDKVAEPTGIEAVPAQALTWGTFAPQTGVRTGIGAGKLELIAQNVWERAKKLGIDPKALLDQVLRGENHATWLVPGAGAAVGAGMLGRDLAEATQGEQRQ